jgi:hypothetical protein
MDYGLLFQDCKYVSPTLLGHKSSSTNFVVIFDIVESVITVELSYNVMKGAEYFLSLYTSVVLTEEYHVTLNSEDLIGTTEYLTL